MTEENAKNKEQLEFDIGNAYRNIELNYKEKKKNLMETVLIQKEIENYWNLLPKDFNGEIDKKSFTNLFSKIYFLLLPKFNQEEISSFIDNEWESSNKGYVIFN